MKKENLILSKNRRIFNSSIYKLITRCLYSILFYLKYIYFINKSLKKIISITLVCYLMNFIKWLAERSRLRPVVFWKNLYINMVINIIHVLINVVKISSNLEKTAIFSQFFFIFWNIFDYNSKTVITTDPGVVSFER